MLLNNEIDESIIKIFGIAARTSNTRCSDDADEAQGGDPPVLQSAGSFVHWQDIKSPNYRHRCMRTATAPEAQLGLHRLKIHYIGATVFYFKWTYYII